MSDLAATNCGGGCSCNDGGCNSIIWIILLLCFCGNNNGCGNNGCGNNGCGSDCLWIILLLFCCGGNGGCLGGNNGCFC